MRSKSLADRIVPALDAVTEGAWIAVVYDLFEIALAHRAPALNPLAFAIAAGIGLAWVRLRSGELGVDVAFVAVVVAGFLVGALVRQGGWQTGDGNLINGLASNPGGWLVVLAIARGTRHRVRDDDDLVIGDLLRFGIPLLALPWILGASVAPPFRERFVDAAFPATLLFATSGLLAMGLARLESLGTADRVEWRRNRSLIVLVGGVLVAMTVIAVPAAFLLGYPISLAVIGIVGPLLVLVRPTIDLALAALLILLSPLQILFQFLQSLIHPRPNAPSPVAGGFGQQLGPPVPDNQDPGAAGVALAVIVGVVVAIGVFFLILRLVRGRAVAARRGEGSELDEREFLAPNLGLRLPSLPRPRFVRTPAPGSASEAYLAFLADLEPLPELRRLPAEPPGSHARRLRETGLTDTAAGRLAADYQLEQYARRSLGAPEIGRALRRWRRLRSIVRGLPRPRG